MLITFIVTVVVLTVLYLLIHVCKNKTGRQSYDFATGAKTSALIGTNVGFGVSLFLLASEIMICFFTEDWLALWFLYGVFLLMALLLLLSLYRLYFFYEAISGDEVYVRRLFGSKKINVNDIQGIKPSGRSFIGFFDKFNTCLFLVEANKLGIDELIRLINERKSDELKEDSQEDVERKALLTKIGQEYRASYSERRKRFIIGFLACGIAFLIGLVLLLYFCGAGRGVIVSIGLLGALALAVNFFIFLFVMKRELNKDDLSLGNEYKFKNQRVKGASKSKFRATCIICAMFMVAGALLTCPLFAIYQEKPNYGEFTQVTGRLEYYRESYGKYSYIAIGLYDLPTEYRLSSIYLDELDYSFFEEVKVGDTVTIFIDNTKDSEFSLRGVDKKQWNDFYYLATDGKEYFTEENYVKSHERNDRAGLIIVGVGAAIFVAAAVTLISSYFICKHREKREEIVI